MEQGICPIAPLALRLTLYSEQWESIKNNWVTSLTLRVTWCDRSRDHWNRRWSFPTGGLLTPCQYLTWLMRYYAS